MAALSPANLLTQPGFIRWAPLGTALPTDLSTAWNVAFKSVGYTKEGSTFTFNPNLDLLEVAEEIDPVGAEHTMREIGFGFDAAEELVETWRLAMNGGGSTTASTVTTLTPPTAAPTAVVLGWESADATVRLLVPRAVQTGSVQVARRKGGEYSSFPLAFRALKPTSGSIFTVMIAATKVA